VVQHELALSTYLGLSMDYSQSPLWGRLDPFFGAGHRDVLF